MGVNLLGSEVKTASGRITVLSGCDYVVAVVIGSVNPPMINGAVMETLAAVAASGLVGAISAHVRRFPLTEEQQILFEGSKAVLFYLENGVCTRPEPTTGFSDAGSVAGSMVTSTDDLLIGVTVGNNGQVTLEADGTAMTLVVDELTCRVGSITPTDAAQNVEGKDPGTLSGYWYTPQPIWHKTTETVLVEEGRYVFTLVWHHYTWWWMYDTDIRSYYRQVLDGTPTSKEVFVPKGTYPGDLSYSETIATWVPPVYETIESGYWEYPQPVWIATGVAGNVSAIVLSVADVMIGSVYTSRPLHL